MANVLGHLYRHTEVPQAQELQVRGRVQLQQPLNARTQIELMFECGCCRTVVAAAPKPAACHNTPTGPARISR